MMALDDGLLLALAGRYEIEREIGQGGMAVVYLARDVRHNRRVALKVLRPELANSLGNERFLQEISIAASLVHPNILPLHDSGEAAGHLYYVMPYVDGLTLRQRLQRERQLAVDDTLTIVRQIAAALDHAHAHGVVHRDIKPENILLLGEHVLVADFGLAKAITRATSQPLTQLGMVVGTPEYMSPEQATPGDAVDPRSDIYSLACVTFEMIAGMPPFRGANAQAVIAHHVTTPPPALCEERHSCPPEVELAVRRGMAKVPADRFRTAGEFVRALGGVGTTTPTPGAAPALQRPARATRVRRRAKALLAVATIAVVAGLVWARARGPLRPRPALDSSTFIVFPFRHDGNVRSDLLDGAGCARMLHNEMARWTGIHLVDRMRVRDSWARRQPETVDDALDAAEALHAGVMAWGEVAMSGDSMEVRAVAYSVESRETDGRQFVIHVGPEPESIHAGFAALADSIVAGGTRRRERAPSTTKNLPAFRLFDAGHDALERFNLAEAEQRFRQAIVADESSADAHLWLARTMSWRGEAPPSEWAYDAARAVALAGRLPARDAAHAAALLSLAEGRMPEACAQYRELLASDSSDFAAWFGLGDCHARDSIVVRDPRSASGFSFRSSIYTAVQAYRRALTLVPSYHLAGRGSAFRRLSRRVLYTEESRLRRGVATPPDSQRFVAFPSFVAETLAFIPVPYRSEIPSPATEHLAVRWSAETYEQIMAEWVRAFPASADAQEAHSAAIEYSIGVSGATDRLVETLPPARRAVAASTSDDERVRRTSSVIRLLLKMDSLAAARVLIDSTLRSERSTTATRAGYLASLAALSGRARLGAKLAARSAADTQNVPFVTTAGRRADYPVPVLAGALEFRVYASLGGPRDSLRATLARTNRLIDVWIAPSARAEARIALLQNGVALAYDSLAPYASLGLETSRHPVLAMRRLLAAGDTAAVRRQSREFDRVASKFLPGTMGTERLYQNAVILLALRDTSAAAERLDAALAALPRVRRIITEVPPQAGAVGRSMMLRAQLAAAQGDRPTAERWTREALTLWGDADADLRVPLEVLRRELDIRSP
jgi:serine/threonine protein kinase/tetratricopeptide (TPR) repeat protein